MVNQFLGSFPIDSRRGRVSQVSQICQNLLIGLDLVNSSPSAVRVSRSELNDDLTLFSGIKLNQPQRQRLNACPDYWSVISSCQSFPDTLHSYSSVLVSRPCRECQGVVESVQSD